MRKMYLIMRISIDLTLMCSLNAIIEISVTSNVFPYKTQKYNSTRYVCYICMLMYIIFSLHTVTNRCDLLTTVKPNEWYKFYITHWSLRDDAVIYLIFKHFVLSNTDSVKLPSAKCHQALFSIKINPCQWKWPLYNVEMYDLFGNYCSCIHR